MSVPPPSRKSRGAAGNAMPLAVDVPVTVAVQRGGKRVRLRLR